MALILSHIGPVGIQRPYEGNFWFSNSQRKCSQLTKTYSVPRGDYLVAWRGTLAGGSNSGVVLINNTPLTLNQTNLDDIVGGMVKVTGATSIVIRGTGDAAFTEDPQVTYVRFG